MTWEALKDEQSHGKSFVDQLSRTVALRRCLSDAFGMYDHVKNENKRDGKLRCAASGSRVIAAPSCNGFLAVHSIPEL
jgi:hypothetical protein